MRRRAIVLRPASMRRSSTQEPQVSIRPLALADIEAVSALCLDAFSQSIAPTLKAEGVATFAAIASAPAFAARMQDDNRMLVFETDATVVGMIELKQGRHIAMLFVSPHAQRAGIGHRLIEAALRHARTDPVTVSASLPSVPAYLRYGFERAGATAESAGLIYQPMTLTRPP
ncbi:GNAT family N-acetyltransferase [Luteimonas terrae]|uniref:N-acetyltransferase YhbS n=1 Tax=Luteimonas terrae TaxID=1530191 RepID=A0ABU1XZU2_9GAMM|nr:GNAT family N-acetyltransferase [Luteimonas terrae]MDR7193541.1 putative N-acetyltransferase YhbS [Luteimonas terrae]